MNMLTKMLLFVLFIDAFLFLGQLSINHVNPSSPTTFATELHLLGEYNTGNTSEYDLETMNSTSSRLPQAQTVDSTSGFTDIYNTVRGWAFGIGEGLSTIVHIFGAPYYFLKQIVKNTDYSVVIYIVGAIWYALSLFVVIAWLFDRQF